MNRVITFQSPKNFYITVLPSGKEGKVTLVRENPNGVEAKRVPGQDVKCTLGRAARWQAQVDITKAEMLDRQFFSPDQTPPDKDKRHPQKPARSDTSRAPVSQ